MKAILLIDHGSRRGEANEMLHCMANMVQTRAGSQVIVRPAHMEIAEPTIEQGFADCVAAGATEVVAFPYMVSPGRHSIEHIPEMVAAAARAHPGVEFRVTPAFGVDEKLAELILARTDIAPASSQRPATNGTAHCYHPRGEAGSCGHACPETSPQSAVGPTASPQSAAGPQSAISSQSAIGPQKAGSPPSPR